MQIIENSVINTIANRIEQQGYIVLPSFIPQTLLASLQVRAKSLADSDLVKASVGRGQQQQTNRDIRRDKIHWLTNSKSVDKEFLTFMELLRIELNRSLFLGLFDYECHYAVYEKCDFYKTHLDALKGKTNRILSTVLYLNNDWKKDDRGELILYSKDKTEALERVIPAAGTMVIFLSEQFPHEVLPANKTRYSIAGWFRANASGSKNIDPAV